MKYFKQYDTDSGFTQTEGDYYIKSVTPGVGIVDDTHETKYNKDYENIILFYDVENESGTTKIYENSSLIGTNLVDVIVDHKKVEKSSLTKTYSFGTAGKHSIIWRFKDSSVIPRGAFCGCTDATHVIFSSKFESFDGGYTFLGCNKMGRKNPIIIPESVKSAGASTFLINSADHIYRTFILLPKTPPTNGSNAFSIKRPGQGPYTGQDTTIYVPWSEDGSILQAYKDAFNTFSYAGNYYKIYELTPDGKIPTN